jgi:hypothetical protein
MLSYSQLRQQFPRLQIDGPGFINPGASTSGGIPGMQGFGNDFLYPTSDRMRPQVLGPNGAGGPIAGMPVAGGNTSIGPNYPQSSIPPATHPPMNIPGVEGYGNDMLYAGGRGITDRRDGAGGNVPIAGMASQGDPNAFNWSPQTSYGQPTAAAAPMQRGPQLANQTAPNYQNPGVRNEAGWWHQPDGYRQGNGQVSSFDQPGWWNDPSGHPTAGVGGNGLLAGGGGGYGGGGSNPFLDELKRKEAINEQRYAEGVNSRNALRQWAEGQLGQLGNQQRADTNRIFDNRQSGLTQDMIGRGLTNSTVQDNQRVGIDSERANAMGRLNESLTQQRLGTEIPLAQDLFNYQERRNDVAPDPSQYYQALAMGGGAGGGPVNIDLSGMGQGGFDNSAMLGGGGFPFMGYGGGYGGGLNGIPGGGPTVNAQSLWQNQHAGFMHDLFTKQRRMSPSGPMVFGPDSGNPFSSFEVGASPGSYMSNSRVPVPVGGMNPGSGSGYGSLGSSAGSYAGPAPWGSEDQPRIGTMKQNQLGEWYAWDGQDWRRS